MTRPKYTYEVESDFSNWDETIFERCLRDGFNVFGSKGGSTSLVHPLLARSPDFWQQGLSSCNLDCNGSDEAEHGQAAIPGLAINPGVHSEGLFHCALGLRLLLGHGVYVTS